MAQRDSGRSRHYLEDGAWARRQAKLRENAEAIERATPKLTARWWGQEPDSTAVSSALWGWAETIRARHRRRSVLDSLWEAIYRDTPANQPDGDATAHRLDRARQNIAKSMVDTVTARLSKRRPMPCISADDAGFAEKLFARRCSRVLRRKMGQSLVERLRPLIVRDAVIRGTGVAKVFRQGGDVMVERIPRREILVDPYEAQYGDPRSLVQVKRVDRSVMLGMYPERRSEIMAVSAANFDEWNLATRESSEADLVDVAEGWHLPGVPGGEDGRHVVCLRGYPPLLDEPWTRMRYPFSFCHWEPPIDGFWGVGLIESLAPIQMEVNKLLGTMGEGITSQMALKVFVQRGAGIEKSHLRAGHPVVIEVDGPEPKWEAPTPFSAAVLQYIQWRIQQAYEMSGVSQASAASKNPLGANASGKALDTMYDIESDRFGDKELSYAMFAVDLGQAMIDEARSIALDDDLSKKEKAPWIRELDWDKVDVDEGTYRLILEPVNFLVDSRAGRLSQVKELAEAGLQLDPMQTAALFDEPDIQRANRHLLGPYRMLERWCEELADEDVPLEDLVPTPQMVAHIDLAKRMCEGELCNVIAEGANDEVQGRFRWALQMLEHEASQAAAPPQGAIAPPGDPNAPMPGAMPPGGPMPPTDPMALAAMGAAPNQLAAGAPAMPPPMPSMSPMDPMGGMTAALAAGLAPPAGVLQ